ncbi:2899_t:CDS:2 [Ambispora gerdemannii]|uniref:2899_t:CDS:1 n=1 Tax=Ambispora gerdemannii TaxID=144530 RepID=A0A9N9GIC7_9GLOM|nr:2899_t:CDS:2 [Ambispora gerdemannii]
MPEYSPPTIVFIFLTSTCILLTSSLLIIILKSKSYFGKWTLFQLTLCSLIENLANLPAVLVYGNDLQDRAFETPLCIIQQKISGFFFSQFQIFPAVLSFYLWWALIRNDTEIEKKCLRYVSGALWFYAFGNNIVRIILLRNEEHWGVVARRFNCSAIVTEASWLAWLVPSMLMTTIAAFFSCQAGFVLFFHWRKFSRRQNRRNAIKLGQAVRLSLSSFLYVSVLLSALIPSIVTKLNGTFVNNITPADYTTSIGGILLFLVFGTTSTAAIFLPCCYYLPPNVKRPLNEDSFNSDSYPYNPTNDETIEAAEKQQQQPSMDLIIIKENKEQEPTFMSVTSEKVLLNNMSAESSVADIGSFSSDSSQFEPNLLDGTAVFEVIEVY